MLAPKLTGTSDIKDFRPISLVGSLCKVIAKVLAARLKCMIGEVIGPCRVRLSIADRFWIVCLLLMRFSHARRCHQDAFLLKVEFHKAFDSILWDYLYPVLGLMGFSAKQRGCDAG